MPDANTNTSASSPAAQGQSSSGNKTPPGTITPHGNAQSLKGESSFKGTVVPESYTRAGCEEKDERVSIKLEDGREVGSTGPAAGKLREKVGYWIDNQKVTVTMQGTTNIIKRVELRVAVEGGDNPLTDYPEEQ